MAENTEAAEPADEEPVQAKLGLLQILGIVALVIVTQVIMKVVLDTFYPPTVAAEGEEVVEIEEIEEPELAVEDLEPANYLPLDPALIVNIRNNGKSQYLQTTIQLMTRDAEVFEAAKLHRPAIRSALIMLFSEVEYDALSTLEGKERLQDNARDTIDNVLQDLAGLQGVDAVYLTSIVFQ